MAAAAAEDAAEPVAHGQRQRLGFRVHVVCDPGGGAPTLVMNR